MLISYANLVYCVALGTVSSKRTARPAISQVDRFKYLGSMETLPEICAGLAIARDATRQLGCGRQKISA